MKGVRGVRKSKGQSWLAKVLRVGLLCWGYKGVQLEIPSEEASTLQIGAVTFPSGQCTSQQLHPCRRLFDQNGHQDSSSASHSPDLAPCDFWLLHKLRGCRYETIEEMKEAVTKVINTLTQEDFHGDFQKLLERNNNALQLEEITSKGTRVSCVYYQKRPYEKSLETYLWSSYIYIYIFVDICIHTHTHTYIYIYIYVCVCMCVCVYYK